MRTLAMRFGAALALVFVAAGCGSATDGSGGSTTTTFEGVIAGDSTSGLVSGKLSLAIATTSLGAASPTLFMDRTGIRTSVTVTGTLTLVGGTVVNLTGNYDTDTHTLSVS